MESWHRGGTEGPSLWRSSSYLSDDTEDTLNPHGSVEAARIGGHCLKNSAHEVLVMDGLCPHGAPKLWAPGIPMSKGYGYESRDPAHFSDRDPPGVSVHSAHTRGSLEDHRLQRT